jgi:phospholipase D1/2
MARILEAPDNCFRVTSVDEIGLLVDAADYYREFYRAAQVAERYILLSGWQFDSGVSLLRGPEARAAGAPVTLLSFLEHLCEQKPALEISILAWDFALVFAAEREWMQRLVFDWTTHQRLRFRFDDNHAERGCHHQKFVVIDGELSFLGGLDLCEDRWDDRVHRHANPLRMSRGEPHKPFHDIQAFARGRALAGALEELFLTRWERTAAPPIQLPEADNQVARNHAVQCLLPIASRSVALSRTDPYGSPGGPVPCVEIQRLHLAAIAQAERLIYAETQYLSSHKIAAALEARMRAAQRPKLEIVLILNNRGETLKEQAAVGLAQAQNIERLRRVAAETGHRLGMYCTLPACDADQTPERTTYIHSKLMIVDDRFLTVGSANLTNRSLILDTELNVSVETEAAGDALARSIRKVRASLLAEHTGGPEIDLLEGLVARLDAIAERGARGETSEPCRLRAHPSPTNGEKTALALIDPQSLPFDPDYVEDLSEDDKLDFFGGLGQRIRELFSSRRDKG